MFGMVRMGDSRIHEDLAELWQGIPPHGSLANIDIHMRK